MEASGIPARITGVCRAVLAAAALQSAHAVPIGRPEPGGSITSPRLRGHRFPRPRGQGAPLLLQVARDPFDASWFGNDESTDGTARSEAVSSTDMLDDLLRDPSTSYRTAPESLEPPAGPGGSHLRAGAFPAADVGHRVWEERSVNATMTCREAGCAASTALRVFDGEREEAERCRLSFDLHPTDFDDLYSGERLTHIAVNGIKVNTDCFPLINGCHPSTQTQLFSCLQEFPVDALINKSGLLHVSAQISDTVDECPYEGNLLAAVPIVTCMVAPKPSPPAIPAPKRPIPPRVVSGTKDYIYVTAPLRCPERGCVARAHIDLNLTDFSVTRCLLSVMIHPTDFDGEDGTVEQLEYVTVDGATLAGNWTPGGNPCKSARMGDRPSLRETQPRVIHNHDVTADAADGSVSVVAKITPHVDECAHDGYLLDGIVEINCTIVDMAKGLSHS